MGAVAAVLAGHYDGDDGRAGGDEPGARKGVHAAFVAGIDDGRAVAHDVDVERVDTEARASPGVRVVDFGGAPAEGQVSPACILVQCPLRHPLVGLHHR